MGGILIDQRVMQLTNWHQEQQGLASVKLEIVSADASFRRYFRHTNQGASYVLVDAPPATEKNAEFVALASAYAAAGIDVPRVIASDLERGFLCLTDLGDQLLLPLLKLGQLDWYALTIKQLGLIAQVKLPPQHHQYYDGEFFKRELDLFRDWFVSDLLKITLDNSQAIDRCFSLLIDSALVQPQVTVHRDFHSRNIMVRDLQSLAIIDFQDTVTGPLTYDAASLLTDCYFELSDQYRQELLQQTHQMYREMACCEVDFEQFKRWFDFMALQRHLKVCGIFSRLYLRDHKPNYLNDLPLVISYIVGVCRQYWELEPLLNLFEQQIIPQLTARTT
jgi:aminoglycoside/choline kinase family phosphotransferase